MFPHLNTLLVTAQLKYIKERDEAQMQRTEILSVSRNPLKILPFIICLGSDIPWGNDDIAQVHRKATAWDESERLDVHTRGDFSSAPDSWSCSDVAHKLALLYLGKEAFLLDLKTQNLTFDAEKGHMPRGVLG